MKGFKLRSLTILLLFISIILISYNKVYADYDDDSMAKFVLMAGKSYKFIDTVDSDIRIDNDGIFHNGMYDYVSTEKTNSKQFERNRCASIKLTAKGTVVITVKDKDLNCSVPASEYNSMIYNETDEKALTEFKLQAGVNYDFTNTGDSNVYIDTDKGFPNFFTSDKGGWEKIEVPGIGVKAKGTKFVARPDNDVTCWTPTEWYKNISYISSKEWKEKTEVDANKEWAIKFNRDLNDLSVTGYDNIKVFDSNGRDLGLMNILSLDRRTVRVTPPDGGYQLGQAYYLSISKNVKDVNNNNLKQGIQMKFTIKK